MAQRVFFFDNIKFFLMMFVIIHHCSMPFLVVDGAGWVNDLYCIIMPFTMASFTMISGYFFKEKPILDRVNTYLIPCMIFSILNITLQRLVSVPFIHDRPITQLGYAMWYLWVLFFYSLMTQFAIRKISTKKLIVLSVLIALLTCELGFFKSENFQISRLISHYPFFLLGLLIKEKNWIKLRNKKSIRLLSFFIFFVLLFSNYALCKYTGRMHWTPAFDHSVPFYIELYGLIVCATLSVCLLFFIPNKKCIISRWGGETIAPYVLHMSIVFPVCWIWGLLFIKEWYGLVLYMFVVPSLCLFLFTSPVVNFINLLFNFVRLQKFIK